MFSVSGEGILINKTITKGILIRGYNKEDIVNRAKQISTYEISIEPYEDCCSFFVPPHPETKAKMEQVNTLNDNLDLGDLYNSTIEKIEKIEFKYIEE